MGEARFKGRLAESLSDTEPDQKDFKANVSRQWETNGSETFDLVV